MPVPANRNKILPARGNYADLNAEVAELLDGEICYAIDQDQYYQKEGSVLVAVGASKAQGSLADTAVQPGDNVSVLTNDSGFIGDAPNDGNNYVRNGLAWVQTFATRQKAITIGYPSNAEKIALFFTDEAMTLAQIRSIVTGSTPSATFSIRYGADFSAAGTEVVTGGITTTNTTTGLSTTVFDNGIIGADNFIWLTTTATSGTVDQLSVTLLFS
jgi:hypothetical protein